jgi:glycosyltransferase involved in cell wall biosynthesis
MTGRVALVTEVIAPYRIPVFNELSDLLDGRLEVFFIAESEKRRDWPILRDEIRFDHQVLGGLDFTVPYRGDRQPVYIARPLLPRLLRGRFDAVLVGGWNHLEAYWSLAYCRLRRARLALWSETPLLGPAPPRRPLRSALKRLVIRSADAYAVPGPSAGRYLEAFGASPERIHHAPNAVDNDFWSIRPDDAEPAEPDRPVLLYVGRLVESKGVGDALAAFGDSELAGRASFLIAGDGPERADLEARAPAGVSFLGACDRDRLRSLYHSADLLVVPSRYDPWGLVVNEAACAGLPALASDAAGAGRDLIRDGENGLVFRAGDGASLRAALDGVAREPALTQRLRAGALAIAAASTPRACAEGLRAALP